MSEGEDDSNINKLDLREIAKIKAINRSKVKWATLYIQMSLCQSTLKQWLEQRNSVREPEKAIVPVNEQVIRMETINEILVQLLKGMKYFFKRYHYKIF